ncbi:glutathione S-transferase C-terminal domain-containing protein isoform X4 [Sceloporus undulatus]|uniref:glutathione S-transferase C-terminal domain-containing protein isoform X4 n=1 Tax=Sceloporus undulatus TaxID=8520 RepID=UPI001C4B5E7D|nr:glutathione S-transferase C-terminal domain-containing protein isoform X4 [Sceloporus undulatus]
MAKKMKAVTEDQLYLDYIHQTGDCIFPLHTSISLFLLSYCDCKSFSVFLVSPNETATNSPLADKVLTEDLDICFIKRGQLPLLVQSCSLPAIVEKDGRFCRAGLAVVLRQIVHKTYEADPSKEDILELLGFKKTCLKACAEDFSKNNHLSISQLPLISAWYQRVQEVPGIKRAAAKWNMQMCQYVGASSLSDEHLQNISTASDKSEEELEDAHFIGGPRPTMTKLMENGIEAKFSPHPCASWVLDWDNLPAAVNPGKGKMSSDRALRKQQQLNNLVALVTKLAKPGDMIVDFCSGGGHVGIVLAHILPSCQVILVENKELSLVRAKERSDELRLNNVWFLQANMDYFKGVFNIGVALHACGVATDMVIERCVKVHAAFVVSPCCYGFIQNTAKFAFPQSHQFKEVLSYKEHMVLCRFADQTAVQLSPERRQIGKCCMGLVDLDRAWSAEKSNYSVQVISMEPETCSPKNNLIVGVPI